MSEQQIAVVLYHETYNEIQDSLSNAIDGVMKKDILLSLRSIQKVKLILDYINGYQNNEELNEEK